MQSLMSTQALAHVMHIPHLVHRAHSQWITHLHTTSRYMHMCRVYTYTYTGTCIYTVTVHTHIYSRAYISIHAHISLHTSPHTLLIIPSLAQGSVCCVSLQWSRDCPMPPALCRKSGRSCFPIAINTLLGCGGLGQDSGQWSILVSNVGNDPEQQ